MSSFRSSIFLTSLALVSFGYSQACQEAEKQEEVQVDQITQLLNQASSSVFIPHLQTFQDELTLLEEELLTLQGEFSTEQHEKVQAQWGAAMKLWQQLEMMQFGPAGSSLKMIGGEDIRDEIYSWPSINRCRVDQKTASKEYENENFFSENLVHAYGLDAIEHLLFASADASCPSQVSPISDGLWQELGEEGVLENRIDYAIRLIDDIQSRSQDLLDRWDPEKEDFSTVFSNGDAPYASSTESLNDVFRALFYLETHTKDRKLAHPLGLKDCQDETCVEDLEGYLSASSLDSIIANLEGFQAVFTGDDGYGFDDYLVHLGHEELSLAVIQNLDDALSYANTLQLPLKEGIVEDKDTVLELHTRIAKITTQLKNELPIVLSLQVPTEAAGDND